MRKGNSRLDCAALLGFLLVATLVLTNGFRGRIFAQEENVDVFLQIEPIGEVLDTILKEHVQQPDVDKVVEGALVGMMNSLDRYSSYISQKALRDMQEDTKGEFQGIGVVIRLDDEKNIVVFQPIAQSPAAKAGIRANDIITAIDGGSTAGMSLQDAANRIRGPINSMVRLTILRRREDDKPEIREIDIKRGNVPLESITEARVLDNGVGYIRISDFKDNTAEDLAKAVSRLLKEGMTSLVLDLRWNPGGLLTASQYVCELFLPKNTLVTYTQGRKTGAKIESLRLYTGKVPLLPETLPMVVLVNELTASCSEIVTGALQYWSRALVVGEKTYGKGSVQTIIPLRRPTGSALRLTTALYYTPAQVTIDETGIKPDVEVLMDRKHAYALLEQMYKSYENDAKLKNEQNHGGVTGNEVSEDTLEDTQLKRAAEILLEDPVFENLLEKYHKDTHETQVAASPDKILQPKSSARRDEWEVIQTSPKEIRIQPKEDKPEQEDAPEAPVPAPVE